LVYLRDKGLLYKDFYEGYYCVGCEQYKSKLDLVDGKCPDHQTEPILMREESYFFKLSEFSKELENKIKNNEVEILPLSRRNEILEFYKNGLKDVSISRKAVKWGIEIPFDKEFTLYVWIDAFLNYLTGLGWEGDLRNIPDFWPPDIQLMAKDIIRVHGTIWLGLVRALEIAFPKTLFVHGYFTVEGQKMSKSLGNVINPYDLLEIFPRDGARFLLAHSLNYGQDTDLSWQRLKDEYNDILVKNLGNLVARVLKLAESCYSGNSIFEFKAFTDEVWQNYVKNMESLKIAEAIDEVLKIVNFANKYIDQEKPWEDSCLNSNQVLSNLLIFLGYIALMLKPFIPGKSEEVFSQLGVDSQKFNFQNREEIEKVKFRPRKKEPLFSKS
jgi:methionyl-tRNA synthetase